MILWLHRHLPVLTRHTLSYRLFAQAEELANRKQELMAQFEKKLPAPKTLTMSAPPNTARAVTESHRRVEAPKTTVATP